MLIRAEHFWFQNSVLSLTHFVAPVPEQRPGLNVTPAVLLSVFGCAMAIESMPMFHMS